MSPDFIFSLIILILSVVIHEVSHGYVAELFGDPTARLAGRLTLNPAKHLDPVGSFLIPAATYLLGGFIIGWAKPVPYNPYNLRPQRLGVAAVAGAGIFANFVIALVFGLLIRFSGNLGIASEAFFTIAGMIVFINLLLAIFNLMPISPLDGSKLLFSVLPYKWRNIEIFVERYGLILLVFFALFLWQFIVPLVFFLFSLITGGARFGAF